MKSTRFLPPRKEAADETKASHEVMELARQNHKIGLLVIQLREAGRSWCDVKARIEAEKKAAVQGHRRGQTEKQAFARQGDQRG